MSIKNSSLPLLDDPPLVVVRPEIVDSFSSMIGKVMIPAAPGMSTVRDSPPPWVSRGDVSWPDAGGSSFCSFKVVVEGATHHKEISRQLGIREPAILQYHEPCLQPSMAAHLGVG
jgi:hypothetical protein